VLAYEKRDDSRWMAELLTRHFNSSGKSSSCLGESCLPRLMRSEHDCQVFRQVYAEMRDVIDVVVLCW
jgi:hypothetical protein